MNYTTQLDDESLLKMYIFQSFFTSVEFLRILKEYENLFEKKTVTRMGYLVNSCSARRGKIHYNWWGYKWVRTWGIACARISQV